MRLLATLSFVWIAALFVRSRTGAKPAARYQQTVSVMHAWIWDLNNSPALRARNLLVGTGHLSFTRLSRVNLSMVCIASRKEMVEQGGGGCGLLSVWWTLHQPNANHDVTSDSRPPRIDAPLRSIPICASHLCEYVREVVRYIPRVARDVGYDPVKVSNNSEPSCNIEIYHNRLRCHRSTN